MSRRKIESPEEYRPLDVSAGLKMTERKSVFERLGAAVGVGRRIGSSNRNNDFDESDLRFRVSRGRRVADLSPNRRSISPLLQTRHHQKTSGKSDDRLDTNSKVKSLVLAPNRRSESPQNHSQSVTSSSATRRTTHSAHKWDDDIDSEEQLEQKRLQLQKELQELEKSGDKTRDKDKVEAAVRSSLATEPPAPPQHNRSRSSSIISSESGSYSSSLKSLTKTESSEGSTKKTVNSLAVKEDSSRKSRTKSGQKSRTHVSSSITLKSVTHSDDSSRKSSEVKFDRHGNVRISLDEQERQKRKRAERFNLNKPIATEPKIVVTREHSYSPPAKRSKESTSERHRDLSEMAKPERSDDNRRDETKTTSAKSIANSSRSKSESSARSRSERRDSRTAKAGDTQPKPSDKSSRTYLDAKAGLRDRSRDSRYSDRDNTSVTSKGSRRRGDNYSRDESPAHSSRSKLSRDRESSIGSDFSRRSKSERQSMPSMDMSVQNMTANELKNSELKANDTVIEEMSPISADSTIPDVTEIDSPNTEPRVRTKKGEERLSSNKNDSKSDAESDDNFSDWSEGEDEILLKTDEYETLDEVCNISDNSMGKDSWTDKPSPKSRGDSSASLSPHNKDDALEAISDDELDAIIGESDPIDSTVDSKTSSANRQVLDALDIDWASLVSEPKTKLEFIPGSARKRFSAANVLMRIGFSQAFAGQHMTQKLIDFCQKELKEEFVPFRHPMAAVHSVLSERMKERRSLFGADTNQVLSGRKDLQIRKMLNKTNFKVFDNYCLTPNSATPGPVTTPPPQQPTSTSSVNDFSVSSTNITETHGSDIECF